VATGPDLRIADADREAAAAFLREHYAQGRLTLGEFNQRLDAVFAATTQSQLSALTRDLPPAAAPSAPLPVTSTAAGRERARREYQSGWRARLGMIPVITAVLTAWLLVFDLHLWMFPWPGRVAIFLAIFAAVRWLMRRIWHLGRGGAYIGCGRYRSGR
jgi:Domain of unknown function (DUF1707)